MNVLDLFSGIGGFSLGLERAGMKTIAFCEIDPFCRKVLKKHWPDVPIHEDVTKLKGRDIDGPVDVICGGFPCQDISFAGQGAGLAGERSGLWREFARLIGEIRPRYVIVENVSALLSRGLGDLLGDLATLGYDAEWHCIPACYVGADHIRDRVWIIANNHSDRSRLDVQRGNCGQAQMGKNASDVVCAGLPLRQHTGATGEDAGTIRSWLGLTISVETNFPHRKQSHKPIVGRDVHGVPNRVDRIRALGNAVVPQIPEMIGRAIMHKENSPRALRSPHSALKATAGSLPPRKANAHQRAREGTTGMYVPPTRKEVWEMYQAHQAMKEFDEANDTGRRLGRTAARKARAAEFRKTKPLKRYEDL